MPDHLADKLQMRYPPRTARCKQEKQCQGFKNTSGTNVKVKKKKRRKNDEINRELQRGEGDITKGICLCHHRVEAVGCPPARKTPPRVGPYISAIWPSLANQARPRYDLQSEDAKTIIPASGSCSFLFFRGRLRGIKLRHRWTPAINEIHRAYAEYLMRCTTLS